MHAEQQSPFVPAEAGDPDLETFECLALVPAFAGTNGEVAPRAHSAATLLCECVATNILRSPPRKCGPGSPHSRRAAGDERRVWKLTNEYPRSPRARPSARRAW